MLQRAVTFYTVSKDSKEMEGQLQQNSGRSERADSGWTHPNLSFGQDSWDDSMILDIFDDAIRSHRTKKGKVIRRRVLYVQCNLLTNSKSLFVAAETGESNTGCCSSSDGAKRCD